MLRKVNIYFHSAAKATRHIVKSLLVIICS